MNTIKFDHNVMHYMSARIYWRIDRAISRTIQTSSYSARENVAISRQTKIFQKLLGNRESGSKKRWYPSEQSNQVQITSLQDIGKTRGKQGKNASRRINVLNKLFMHHITDQLATGSLSEEILGKGLEISRVKVSPDFQGVAVYWIARGGAFNDSEIEKALHRCSGVLRHELSQLRLMGEVPRIHFVKDKTYLNLIEVEDMLNQCDLGDDYEMTASIADRVQEELGLSSVKADTDDLPVMRHDVFGLDHKQIMSGILARMKKSKDAWNTYNATEAKHTLHATEDKSPTPRLDAMRLKLNEANAREEKFQKFLSERNQKKMTPDRKKPLPVFQENQLDYNEQYFQDMKDDGDFIEEYEMKKH